VGNIASAIKNGFQTAINFITGLPSQALQWGKDIINGIVDGIKSCMSAVGDAVKGVADKIKSFLHFSVPDEGPLTDYESWMPDFMEGLAKGIDKSKSVVAKAVEGVSQDMVINPNVSAATSAMETSSSESTQNMTGIVSAIREMAAQMNQSGDTVIPVYIGGTQIDEIILKAQSRQNLRSGGRA
jgi:phage-related protein